MRGRRPRPPTGIVTDYLLVVLLIVGVAVVAVVIGRRLLARDLDRPAAPTGPTDEPYPPGSRPAGPGAEGMGVGEPGDIIPGPDPRQDPDQPS